MVELTESTEEMISPGEQLKAAREKKGWDPESVAQKLCWSVQRVQDLETDQYDHRLAMVYLRGYMKAYARLLGIDVELLLNSFENTEWAQQRRAYEASMHESVDTTEHPKVHLLKMLLKKRYLVPAVSVLVIAMVAWFGFRNPTPPPETVASPNFVVQPQTLPEKRVTNSGEMVITPVNNTKQ